MNLTEKFIIDTNTIISSLLIRNSVSFKTMEKARNKGLMIFSNETFLEFELVLFRNKFDKYFSKEERLQIVQKTYTESTFVPVNSTVQVCRDPNDNKFLNLAIDSSATCIITGDNDLLILHPFQNIPILSPSEFLRLY